MKFLESNRSNKYILLGIIVVLVLGVVGCSSKNKEIVGQIGDEVITKDELYDLLVGQNGAQMVEMLISERLVNLEAKKRGIDITDEQIQAELGEMIEDVGGEAMFDQWLLYNAISKEEALDNIKTNIKIKELVIDRITISQDEIKEYFEANKDKLSQVEQIQASHILVKEKELSEEIQEKLQNGGDFSELAKEYSIDGSAQFGGDLGFFGKGAMVKEFEEAAFSLEIDEISEIVETEHGYHIILAVDKIEAKEATLAESKEKIEKIIVDQKMSAAYQEWYEETIKEYTVVNNLIGK